MNMHMNHGGKRGALAPRHFVPPSCILGHWSLRCVSSRQAQPWIRFLDERRMGGPRSVQPFWGLRVSEMGFDQDILLGTFSASPFLWPPPGLEGVVLGIAGRWVWRRETCLGCWERSVKKERKPQKCGHERVLEKTIRNLPILQEHTSLETSGCHCWQWSNKYYDRCVIETNGCPSLP